MKSEETVVVGHDVGVWCVVDGGTLGRIVLLSCLTGIRRGFASREPGPLWGCREFRV